MKNQSYVFNILNSKNEIIKEGSAYSGMSNLDDDSLSGLMDEDVDDYGSNQFDDEMVSNSVANLRAFNVKKEIIEQQSNILNKMMPRVLVICTGGTFTMINTPRGYVS